MKFVTRALASLSLTAGPASVATADAIYTRPVQSTLYISRITDSNGTYEDRAVFRYGGGPKSKPHADLVSAGLIDVDFTPQSIGQTWASTATSDPDFAPLAAILTNGADDATFFRLEGYKGTGYTANAVIGSNKGLFFWFGATDLAGYTLSSISVRLDALKINDDYPQTQQTQATPAPSSLPTTRSPSRVKPSPSPLPSRESSRSLCRPS